MVGLERILVATDFSDSSTAAVEEARQLAVAFGATVHLLHVVNEPLQEAWAGYAPGSDFLSAIGALEREAKRRLGSIAQAHLKHVPHVLATTWGDPSARVLEYAAAHHIDLIVAGTHGRTGWSHVVMGSVAERLVRLARCPVLTVRARPSPSSAAA